MKRNKKILVSMALAVVMMVGVVGCGKETKPVATINGQPLTESSYKAYLFSVKMEMEQGFGPGIWELELEGETMEGIAKERALESAVAMSTTSEKAKEMDIKLTAEEKEEAKTIAANYSAQLKEQLEEGDVTEDAIRLMMEEIIISQAVLEALAEQFTPSEDAEGLAAFMEENKQMFESVTAQHVLISTVDEEGNPIPEDKAKEAEDKAKEVLEKALAGEDMGTLAKEYSEDPGSKDNGGEYTFQRGQMVPEFEEAAFNGEAGVVYPEIVETSHGYHIVKTVEKTTATEEEMKTAFEETQKAAYINGEIEEWITAAKVEKTDLYDTITIKKAEAEGEADAEGADVDADTDADAEDTGADADTDAEADKEESDTVEE